MNKQGITKELEQANSDAIIIWHNTQDSNRDREEVTVQRIYIDRDKSEI